MTELASKGMACYAFMHAALRTYLTCVCSCSYKLLCHRPRRCMGMTHTETILQRDAYVAAEEAAYQMHRGLAPWVASSSSLARQQPRGQPPGRPPPPPLPAAHSAHSLLFSASWASACPHPTQ